MEAWAHHDDAWKQIETFGPGRMAAFCLEAKDISDDESINKLTREFEEASLNTGVKAVEGAKTTLEALTKANIRVGLVCDTGFTPGRVVRELLDREGLLAFLECQCFSDECGVPKPGNEIFAKCLAELGVSARPKPSTSGTSRGPTSPEPTTSGCTRPDSEVSTTTGPRRPRQRSSSIAWSRFSRSPASHS